MSLIPQNRAAPEQALADALRPYGAGRQFALLGAAQLDVLTYFAGMQATHGADYAEHALIEGQPALQFIGAKLQERKIEVLLHAGLCAPADELLRLQRMMAAHEAQPLVYANGNYAGNFVITQIDETTRHAAPDGTPLLIELALSLREYVRPKPLAETVASRAAVATSKQGARGKKRTPPKTVSKKAAPRTAAQPTARNNRSAYWKS